MDIPLSEKWVQIGVTFCPIPSVLWGRRKEIEAEAARRGIGTHTPPAQIAAVITGICKELKRPNIFGSAG
jgi:hypothetical protein